MRGRPIRVLLLLTLVPLLIVVVLLAVAALDGRGAERPREPAASTCSRCDRHMRIDVGRGVTGLAISSAVWERSGASR